ncbi:YopT-type cysteine protease domain-containing protein [Pasteurella oralis]|uniref:YopT-type cysteine protease domain-containing protein n=1 Tax=Pasteurella oralis TaxID=1071947 RepID=UPI000C7C96CD|nr:YopT-type cysteine protease domain-containing protein [Pasteurella oralis]
MNKNRYKLIFSKSKGCLVPVAECIKSAVNNGSSDSLSEADAEEPPLVEQHDLSALSLLIKTALNPVSSVMQLTWKQFSILLLTVATVPALAQEQEKNNVVVQDENGKALLTEIKDGNNFIKLDNNNSTSNDKTKLYETSNKVIVIDIAKPNGKGISDNRFQKFSIENGAVFKNNKAQQKSALVGYLEGNTNLTEQEAKVILNQVKGSELSKIEGALEVLGQKADLVIANQNGITLNGVQTINTDRFVATTSKEIDPSKMILDVEQGKVTIDVNGFATDGLKYLDIVAKTIEQKEAITNKDKTKKAETEITFIAGKSKYDFDKREVVKDSNSTSSTDIAITGASTGAMHGKNIKLIVTDKGAGVKHDGIILSEEDIHIEIHDGDVELGNTQQIAETDNAKKVHAKKAVKITNSNRTIIGSEVKADSVEIKAKETTLRKNTKVSAKSAKIDAQKSIKVEEDAKLVATKADIKTATLTNDGRIYGREVDIDANNLANNKEIYSESKLKIKTKGKSFSVFEENKHKPITLVKEEASLNTGFVNKGVISSKGDAELTFKDKTSFISRGNNFINARDNLKINAENVEIAKDDDVQLSANIEINVAANFVNYGTLASGQALKISSQGGNIYNVGGILGAASSLSLFAKKANSDNTGNIINQANSLLHTNGQMNLEADRLVYNLGNIFSKQKMLIKAHELVNDVQLSGGAETTGPDGRIPPLYRRSNIANHGWHNNFYNLEMNLTELGKSTVKVENMGYIRSEGDLEFISGKGDKSTLRMINHGVINVKGTLNSDADEIDNSMVGLDANLLTSFFKQPANITFYYQPKARFLLTALSGKASRKFESLEAFLDALLSPNTILTSSSYHADNAQATLLLKEINSPTFKQAMGLVFGAGWQQKSHNELSKRWREFKEKQDVSFVYRPEQKAKILASKLGGKISTLQNGEYSERGQFSETIQIGKHVIELPKAEFRPQIAEDESLDDNGIDLSTIAEILSVPNLFIDDSVQLKKPNKLSDSPKIDEEDANLLSEPDYDNPDEVQNNAKLLKELLIELKEEQYLNDDEYFESRRDANRKFESLPRDVQRRLHEQFAKKREEQAARRKELVEKARAEKEKLQRERLDGFKEEEVRQERDKVEKQKEIKEAEQQEQLKKEKEAERAKEIAEKQAKEKEVQRLANEKAKKEAELKAEAKKEELEKLAEYEKILEEEQKKEAEVSKNRFLKDVDDNRPKVETDPLYRTKLQYINQDDYFGSQYFFNKVAPKPESEKSVKVIGDNYFEHELINRSIEKKVENHLALKYNLTDAQLVKKLMDNSYFEAKELGLEVGRALTKEQQANLKQDIVWYVKTNLNGKEVFVPQVYLTSQTLNNAAKFKGLGSALISAREITLSAKNVRNAGTISGQSVHIEAEEKIQNKGDILSSQKTRLVGRKGIENLSRSYINEKGNVEVVRSRIETDGHVHLETDLDSTIDSSASVIKGKTGFVKTKDLNVTDTYTVERSSKKEKLFSQAGSYIGYATEDKTSANSVASTTQFDHLHLAVENNVNQVGSKIKARVLTGITKGDYNTKAGQNLAEVTREEHIEQVYSSAHASGGGKSVRHGAVGAPTTNTGLGALLGFSISDKKETESLLSHTNSDLEADMGKFHVLGNADIGGVDINKHLIQTEVGKLESSSKSSTENKDVSVATDTDKEERPLPKFNTLTAEEIVDLMSEKTDGFYKQYQSDVSQKSFELSAKEIKSTKQKDEYHLDSQRSETKFGAEIEGHSAIADAASHLAKQFIDAQNGIKQDGTVALQQVSDAVNLITGDLIGSSAKISFETNKETKKLVETGDIRTKIGGNVTLSAREGSVTLKNVESGVNTNLTLNAKQDVNIQAGEKTTEIEETQSRQKVSAGVNAGCSVMSAGCNVGASVTTEGNESFTHEIAKKYNNSLLQGKNVNINAGGNFNLESSNIDADYLDLNVKGKTNIISKQDTVDRKHESYDYNASVGASLSTATVVKPTANFGVGYTNEVEQKRTVNKQAGVKANKITGKINDLNLEAGYIINNDKSSDFRVVGNVTSNEIHDFHDKDGGTIGASVGLNERGTSAFNVRGGRAEQKHYAATQKSTLSGINVDKSKISGTVTEDLTKSKEVTRDDTYASTEFNFEVADIAELGQKAKNRLKSSDSHVDNDSSTNLSTPKSRVADDADSVNIKNPIYESVDSVAPTARSRNVESSEMVDNPLYSTVATRKRGVNDDLPEVPSTKSRSGTAEVESTYAEINTGARRKANDLLPELPNSAQSRAKSIADTSDNIYEDVSSLNSRTQRPLPEAPNAKVKSIDSEGIYSQIDDVATIQPRAKSKSDESDYESIPLDGGDQAQPRVKPRSVESDYETIPSFDTDSPTVEQPRSRSRRAISEENAQVDSKVQSIFESTANKARSSSTEDVYATLDKTPEGRARAKAKGDEAAAQNPVSKARVEDDLPPALPKRPNELGSEVDSGVKAKSSSTEDVYTTLDKTPEGRARAKAKGDEAAAQNPVSKSRVEDDVAPALPKRPNDLSADVESSVKAKAERPLPEVPTTQALSKNRITTEGDYAQIEESVAKPNSRAKRELPDLPSDNVAKSRQLQNSEGDYAEIGHVANKSRSQIDASVVEPQSTPTEANTNNNSNRAKKVETQDTTTELPAVAKAEKTEKSWLSKVKDFFTSSSNKEQTKEKVKASKSAKAEEQDAQANAKPRYDDLEDNLNLKGLLALEDQRNKAFDTTVLKNAEFLAEAREAAKKYIPEATIKQMGNSPEFDDIMTEGARKIEKRINDAVTFKPTVEEFSEIQGLVKKLPKGDVIDDVSVKTQNITEALAETSKTIQRNPKLKEEVQGAIEEFLKSSQGKDLTVEMVEKLNHGLRPDEGSDRQLYKKETLTKENAVFSSPEASKIQLSETVDFINQAKHQGVEPSVLAGLVYQRLIAYHPFAEGNGRMARVIVNKLLLDAGYPPFTKFNSDFETQIIPQTLKSAKSATSAEVVKEFLTELGKKPLPEASTQPRVKNTVSDESDYAEIGNVVAPSNSKATRALPELPSEVKGKASRDSDYADIDDFASTAKRHSTVVEDDVVNKVVTEEPIYATVDKSAEARAKANARSDAAEAANPKPKVATSEAEEDFAPLLPIRPELKDAAGGNKKAKVKSEEATSEQAEKSSLFQRVKQFFTGKDSAHAQSSKVAKTAEQDLQAAAKPRYDDLEDNINLKNLLALEDKRNESFESNVLKNAKFLDEAREAAKKSIPEATIKQMGNSPEFDEILTDGARKVEKRINDAVSFKPSVEEFSEIQGLVKKLPKGDVIDDVSVKTQNITEALAETSKTIQRNPKLKEEVQGAIEEFLKSSQGKDLTVEMVEKLNHGLRPDEGSDRQLYKKETLTKENAVFSSPEASKIQLSETVDFINQAKHQGVEPSVLAGLVYQRLIAYHPFAEGNGRMARVIVNKLLLDAGYPPFTKFNSDFETQIIPQTLKSAKSATSAEVVKEFLTELGKKPLPEASTQPRVKNTVSDESDYAEIGNVVAPSNSKATRALPELPSEVKGKASRDSDYADIDDFASTAKRHSTVVEDDVVNKVVTEEPIYATVDKSAEARAKANARSDAAEAANPKPKVAEVKEDVAPELPPRTSEFASTSENAGKTGKPPVPPKPKFKALVESDNDTNSIVTTAKTKEKPPVAPKPKVKVIVENDADGVAKTRVVVQPEVAEGAQLRSRSLANSDYAEVTEAVVQVQPRAKARQSNGSDYEDISEVITQSQAQASTKARTAEESVTALNKIKVDDGLYATIDKSPEALARAKAKGDEAAAAQPPVTQKVQLEEQAPALPKRSADLMADDSATLQGNIDAKFRSLPVDAEIADTANTAQAPAKATPVSDRIQQKELVEQSRGVLKQVQDQFQPLKVKGKIDAVRSSVEEYGGEVSFKYAQSKGEVYKEIVKHLETQHGVCESTCAHWIAKKVDPQDDNFWTSLYEGGQKGHLKKEAIDSIKKLQTEFINSGSATQQFKLTDSWLQEQGVVPKEKKFGNLSRRDEVAGTVSKTDVSALSKAILDTGNETSAVKKISINLEGGSHTVSAAIQGQKVVFFDPNFGEMTFPSHQKFEAWLKDAFWNKSGYAGKQDGKRFFNVVNYELPAKTTNNTSKVKPAADASDINAKTGIKSDSQSRLTDETHQIKRDETRGESYVAKDNVVTAITNTSYIPKPVTDVDAQFEKVRQKAKSTDSAKEAEKKLALIAKESKNLPKEHLLKATDELINGMSSEDRRVLRQQEHKAGAVLPNKHVIQGFEGENVKSMGKILKNIQFDESYVETRKQINEKIIEKLDSNKEFHDLMKGKLSGNEEGIRKLFDIVETAKRESLKEVTGIEGTKAKLELNTKNGPLSMGQGHYSNDEVHMNSTPIASFLRSKKRNNQEILDTIVHELTHHDQAQISKNKYDKNLSDNLKKDANLLALNENYYIDADVSNFGAYKKQPLEREAFSSGHSLSKELSKLVERGYQGKVQEIQTIEHLPNKLNNLESPRAAQSDLSENALIYGLQQGRKELIARANAADVEGKNAILADSYIGKLNLGFEFSQLSSFAKQVKSGNVTEQDIQEIASFNEPTAKLARRDDSKNRINDANIEDNQRIIRELIKNENAVDALKRIATLTDQEQNMYDALRKNDKFDMEELQESSNYTTAENRAIREYKETQNALNDARMDFFTEKTKFIAKETLERGGQLYFALDGLATDTATFKQNTQIDLNRLKAVFEPSNPHYDSVTSRELRYLYENYKDHPNLKFTIKDHVIENPLKTLEIPTANNTASVSGEQSTAYKKQLLPNLFKRKVKAEGPKIEHLGGNSEKDAFYFPLDKIVTKDRSISKDMKVNMDNIKKAFNPKDKHYNSSEAKNLRALYAQDPTMSSTRFVIGNQVIENPFKSPELQEYIQKHHVSEVATVRKAKPLPALPNKAAASKETALKQANTNARKPVQPPKPKVEQIADPNAIYAQVNKNRKSNQVDGFYSESQLRTRSDKIVEQVSNVLTTEPTYADLQFSHKTNRSQPKGSDNVVYGEVASKVKGSTPNASEKLQKSKQELSKGIIPESQLKTRSDKVVEQVSRVPTTEPVYADLQFPASGMQTKQVISSSEETIYAEVGKKSQEEPIYQNVIRKGAK